MGRVWVDGAWGLGGRRCLDLGGSGVSAYPASLCPHCCSSSSSCVLGTCLCFVTWGFLFLSLSFPLAVSRVAGLFLPCLFSCLPLSCFVSIPFTFLFLFCSSPANPLPFSASDAILSFTPTCSPSVFFGVFRQALSFATQTGFKLRPCLSLLTVGIIDRQTPA